MKSFFLFFILLATSVAAKAQEPVEMADNLRAEGKIYVVVGCMTIIMLGLLVYVFRLERKVNQLESHLMDRNHRN